jgi:ribosomal protein S12 methylthiotransferase
MKRFYIHKLGCPKNDVDADYIAGFLQKNNLQPTDDPASADLIIVNSCGFISAAKEESIDAIMQLAGFKKGDTSRKLVLTGCLAQRYAPELAAQIPELDGIFGLNDFQKITELLGNGSQPLLARSEVPRVYPDYAFTRAINPNEQFAYIKISDGCDNRCSYCAIPDIRGHFRSRTMAAIVDESRLLLDRGKKELILVSQESTAYGRDIYQKPQLLPLLDQLTALPGEYWIRLMYLHPARLEAELIDYIIDNPRICAYFDIPLQHISDKLLEAMNRRISRDRIEQILDHIRSHRERAAIRTGFIVGFPGETESDFELLCRFVEEKRFDRLGAFVYSREEETPAAALADQIDDKLAQERYDILMEIQRDIAFENNEQQVGIRLDVLVEEIDPASGETFGRTQFDAPEIDQTVRIKGTDHTAGEFVSVEVIAAEGYDLIAERRR